MQSADSIRKKSLKAVLSSESTADLNIYGDLKAFSDLDLDDIAVAAAALCRTPIALVSILDGDGSGFPQGSVRISLPGRGITQDARWLLNVGLQSSSPI